MFASVEEEREQSVRDFAWLATLPGLSPQQRDLILRAADRFWEASETELRDVIAQCFPERSDPP